jgi:hypothetical protein
MADNNNLAADKEFPHSDGFYCVELPKVGRFDVCVIQGAPRYVRARDTSEPIAGSIWDILTEGEGNWFEAAPFTKAQHSLGKFMTSEEAQELRCPKSPDGAHVFVFGSGTLMNPAACEYCGKTLLKNGEFFSVKVE